MQALVELLPLESIEHHADELVAVRGGEALVGAPADDHLEAAGLLDREDQQSVHRAVAKHMLGELLGRADAGTELRHRDHGDVFRRPRLSMDLLDDAVSLRDRGGGEEPGAVLNRRSAAEIGLGDRGREQRHDGQHSDACAHESHLALNVAPKRAVSSAATVAAVLMTRTSRSFVTKSRNFLDNSTRGVLRGA